MNCPNSFYCHRQPGCADLDCPGRPAGGDPPLATPDAAFAWLYYLAICALGAAREVTDAEMRAIIGSIAHLAYHLGAVRQMDQTLRGPVAHA